MAGAKIMKEYFFKSDLRMHCIVNSVTINNNKVNSNTVDNIGMNNITNISTAGKRKRGRRWCSGVAAL